MSAAGVLAVMDAIAEFIADADPRSEEIATADRLLEARAAVAELMNAAEGVIEMEHEPRFLYGEIDSLRAALARIAPNELHDKAAELRGRGE